MKVLFASSEVFPFSKTGGLADVSGSLPIALKDLGVDISIITPLYKCVYDKYTLTDTNLTFSLPISDYHSQAEIKKYDYKNVPVYFVENKKYFFRDELYTTKEGDYPDNAERFIFFSKAIIEFAKRGNFDILHLNDWQTAMAAVYAKTIYKWHGKVILTIHNLGYQGIFWALDMPLTNLGWEYFTPSLLEFWGKINFLKGGIYSADAITTVSKQYAREILQEEFGFGLSGVLRDVKLRLYGIINGIDYNEWSPEKDSYIIEQYNQANVTNAKKACKIDLLRAFELNESTKTPVIGIISRLTEQKGWDLIQKCIEDIMKKDIILIILGTGEASYVEMLKDLKARFPEKIALMLTFDNAMAHKIEAGSDFFLMPSKYEPCGLNQMISMRYGTIPIVHAVGGLEDTVIDIGESKDGYGIKFRKYEPSELINAIERAISLYKDPLKLSRIRRKAMRLDFSWKSSANDYVNLYRSLIANV